MRRPTLKPHSGRGVAVSCRQSGDLESLDRVEKLRGLVEEANPFEEGAVEVREEDIPDEYLDKDSGERKGRYGVRRDAGVDGSNCCDLPF